MLFVNEMDDGELKDILVKTFESFDEKRSERRIYEDIRRTLIWMMRAISRAKAMDEILVSSGYSANPYADICDNISDAIYHLIGETEHRFENSLTYITLHADAITDEHKIELLLNEYKKNRPALV